MQPVLDLYDNDGRSIEANVKAHRAEAKSGALGIMATTVVL
jgi:hypothetical protein